jgi:hypothetical protein
MMNAKPAGGQRAGRDTGEGEPPPRLTLQLDSFTSKALLEESARMGVSREEFAKFSVLYYLADVDSGRIARRVPYQHLIAERAKAPRARPADR